MAITNPTLPWAIVLCQLEGSHPDPSIVTSMYELFVSNPRSLATFWRDQTYGAVDLTGSKVFGWYPCGWAIHTSPPEFLTPIHPGVTASVPRPTVVAQARQVLVNHNSPEILAEFRGVIAVYNFSVSGGFSGADVAYGLDGATSGLDWAESGWQQCQNCTSMIAPLGFNLPCTNTSAGAGHTRPGAYPDGTIPVFGVCTDALVAGTLGGFAACWKCGCLFDASMETGSVTCAAGAHHGAAAGSPYYAMQWADPLNGGDGRNLYRCTNCGIVTHGTKTVTAGKTVISPATNLVCPATKVNHVLDVTELTFPRLDRAAYDRTFLAHEIGHAYGFQHGLGWRVQSLDLTDDCLPSAYGDRWTIMSAMNCDSVTPASTDVDAALGQSGPGLALHHLVTAGGLADLSSVVTAPITADGTVYTIRPPHDTTVPGVSGIRAGRCLIEMRDLKSWDTNLQDSDLPNRQSLAADGLSAGIAVYDMTPMLPTRLMMPSGRPHLEAGEWFEDRHGLGGVRIEVETMTAAPPSATLRVTNTGESIVNRFQRWLILRTVYPDGTDPSKMPDALALLTGTEGVEQFWNEMAGGKFFVAGGDIAFDPNHSDGWIRLADPSAVDQARLFTDRVTRTIAAVLSLKNPTNTNNTPVYFDWRNFTGFIVVRNTPLPSVTVGEMVLPSGNATDFMPDCGTEQRTGISAGNLSYGVIEVGSNHLTHATLASAIGQTLGLAPFSADPYDIMGAGVYAGEFGAHPTYGLAGPRASSDSLVTLGWLDPGQIAQPEGTIGDPITSGFVTLGPLTQAGNPNLPVRAEIGPYSFEFRIQSDAQRWDQGLPQAAAVIARSDDGETVLVNVGSSVTWGGPPASWAILGGGAVTVKEIDPGYGFVVLEFASHMGHRYIAGGQWGDGTLFTYFHGHLVRLPPGDPYGGMLAAAVQTFEFVARARESAARQRRGVRTSAGLVDDTERPASDAGGDVRSRLP